MDIIVLKQKPFIMEGTTLLGILQKYQFLKGHIHLKACRV